MSNTTDRWQAQYTFWSSFGLPAYEENSVPVNEDYPYITYEAYSSPFDGDVAVSASVWTRRSKWTQADSVANAILDRLKDGGVLLPYDGGVIWVTADRPIAQSMGDPDDNMVKRKLIRVILHFC